METEKHFGRWLVIGNAPPKVYPSQTRKCVMCRCSCDKQTVRSVVWWDLTSGKSLSCGCIHSEVTSARSTVHGMSRSPLKNTYRHMLKRCYDQSCREWKWYGGRAVDPVVVCSRWRASVAAFYDDMAPTWKRGLTLDRKDPRKGYTKSNCRWITRAEQQRNRLNHRRVSVDGCELILAVAAEAVGVSRHMLKNKLNRGHGVALIDTVEIRDLSKS